MPNNKALDPPDTPVISENDLVQVIRKKVTAGSKAVVCTLPNCVGGACAHVGAGS